MRKDMAKVLTERPRVGGDRSVTKRTRRQEERRKLHKFDEDHDDTLSKKESMRRPHKEAGDSKQFSDLLGPLQRFLRSKVGKPWDAIYSEICDRISAQSVAHLHLRQHVNQMVDQETYIEDGVVCQSRNYWRWGPRKVQGFYVHPVTGLLAWEPYAKRTKYMPHKNLVCVNNRFYLKKNDVWFELVLRDLPNIPCEQYLFLAL